MSREKKETYATIIPKTENGKLRMDYHGERWIYKGQVDTLKYSKGGPWHILISRDGTKCLHIKKENDIDFDVRL